ncbi:MAG: hypothetical protein ACREOP_10340, partial [Thermodesulfobacteriota bacterium]
FGFFNAGPYDGQVMNFPINYKWNFKGWPKLSWIFDLPITLTRDETGWAYMASFGTGFQFRPYKWWSASPRWDASEGSGLSTWGRSRFSFRGA